jgi:hypothetical protein
VTGGFDPAMPNAARVYSRLLGGKDHFPADRAEADLLLEIYPPLAEMVQENRAFIAEAVTWAASGGVGQFIDLGTGLSAPPQFTRPRRRSCPEPGWPTSTWTRWCCRTPARCSPAPVWPRSRRPLAIARGSHVTFVYKRFRLLAATATGRAAARRQVRSLDRKGSGEYRPPAGPRGSRAAHWPGTDPPRLSTPDGP